MTKKTESVAQEATNYGYYSKVLCKPFDTIEELQAAEKEHNELLKAEEEKANKKRELAKTVEEAYKSYLATVEDTNKRLAEFQKGIKLEVQQAKEKYVEAKNEFIDTYGSFHMTYKDKEPVVDTSVEQPSLTTTFDDLFDAIRQFPTRLFW